MSLFTSSMALALSRSEEDNVVQTDKIDDFAAIQKELLVLESKSMISGVVSIKVKSISLYTNFKTRGNVYTTIQNRNFTRKSRVVSGNQLLWNEITHLPVNVVKDGKHPFNCVKISLMEFTLVQDKIKIGQVMFHLHDIIKAAPVSGTYFLWNNNSQIGVLDVEITFSYGRFGYGYSKQIQEEDTNSWEKVVYSLFPRINPTFSECEKGEAIQEFTCLDVPHVLKSAEPIEFRICKEIKSGSKNVDYYPSLLLSQMDKLQHVKDEYFSNTDRVSRLLFLSNYLTSKIKDEIVFETGTIPSKQESSSKNYLPYVVSTQEHLNKQKFIHTTKSGKKRFGIHKGQEDKSAENNWKFINIFKKTGPINDDD